MIYLDLKPAAAEPLSLEEVRAHLRLSDTDEDSLLAGLIRTARAHLERTTGLITISRPLRLIADQFPCRGVIRLTRGPVTAITAATVYDERGSAKTLDLSGIGFERGPPGRVVFAQVPPPGRTVNGFELDFTAGFGASGAEVPEPLRQAMLMHVATMYAYRGAVTPEDQPAALPNGYRLLVAPFRAGGL